MIEQATAFVEQFGFRRIQVFRVVIGVHGATAKGNAAPACVADREHDAIAKRVIGLAALAAGLGQTGTMDQVFFNPLGAQLVPQPLPGIGGKADLPPVQLCILQATPGQIIARRSPRRSFQLKAEILHGHFHDLGQLRAPVGLFLRLGIARRHLHAGLGRQDFNRFHKADILGLADKGNRVALGVTAKAIIISLAVIHMKGRAFFLVERAWCPHVTLALI